MYTHKYFSSFNQLAALLCGLLINTTVSAGILPDANVGIKLTLTKPSTNHPMTVAYQPTLLRYYVADGGLAPMGSEVEAPESKSEIHTFSAEGKYLSSAKPGYDNRSIYYNPNTGNIETITYNISSAVGFAPNTGIYSLKLSDNGELTGKSEEIMQFNPAFGDAATIPSYDAEHNLYYAKQMRSNKLLVVDAKKREPTGEVLLDLASAGAKFDDISDNFIAYTGVKGNELALLDVDHKAVLVFDLSGRFVGKSALPQTLKLHAKNYYNGLGYANNMMFVLNENEGEFGTYYGLKIFQ